MPTLLRNYCKCDHCNCTFPRRPSRSTKHKFCSNYCKDSFHKENLTERQKEIIALVAEGLENKEIMQKLFISSGTLSTHLSNIFYKTQTNSCRQLICWYYKKAVQN